MIFVIEMVAIGGLTGILAGLLGGGGGFIMIPLLNTIGFPMREAAGLSLLYVAFAVASGTLRHFRQGTLDPMLGLILVSGGTPMVTAGSHLANILPNQVLEALFAFLVMGATAMYWGWGRGTTELAQKLSQGQRYPHGPHILLRQRRVRNEEMIFTINVFAGLAVGACVGFVSGLLGLGGGWLLVPLLVVFMRIPLPVAIGTSLLGILGPAIAGAASYWWLGNLDLAASIPLILSGIIGAQLGALLAVRIDRAWLERLFVLVLSVASAYMLARGLRFM